jgi:hypothetical protein
MGQGTSAPNNAGKGKGKGGEAKSRFEKKLEEYNKFKSEFGGEFTELLEQIDGINALYNTAFQIHKERLGRAEIPGNAETQKQMRITADANSDLADDGVSKYMKIVSVLASLTREQKRTLTDYLSSMRSHYTVVLGKAERAANRGVRAANSLEGRVATIGRRRGLNNAAAAAYGAEVRAATVSGTNAAMNAALGKGAAGLSHGTRRANAGKGAAGKGAAGHEGGRRKTRKGRKGTRKGRKGTRKGRKGSRKGNRRH